MGWGGVGLGLPEARAASSQAARAVWSTGQTAGEALSAGGLVGSAIVRCERGIELVMTAWGVVESVMAGEVAVVARGNFRDRLSEFKVKVKVYFRVFELSACRNFPTAPVKLAGVVALLQPGSCLSYPTK